MREQCKQALDHYLELSDAACHYDSLIPLALEVYQRVREHYDNMSAVWESWTWQRGFNPGMVSDLNQLEEFLGIDSSGQSEKHG